MIDIVAIYRLPGDMTVCVWGGGGGYFLHHWQVRSTVMCKSCLEVLYFGLGWKQVCLYLICVNTMVYRCTDLGADPRE